MTFLLIDGQYWCHAAQAVAPMLTRADGHPIGAVYGYTRRLMNFLLRSPIQFDHVAVVFDAGGRGWRHEVLPAYKANRAASRRSAGAGALSRQLPLIHAATEALGVRAVLEPAQEADDIIATLARRARQDDSAVVIVSSDKDLLQLIDTPAVRIYDTHPDPKRHNGQARGWQDEKTVRERFGVYPTQIPDYLALVGDASDNIPGVRGFGPKKAAAILNKHGDIASALLAGDLPSATETIAALMTSRSVATLSTHVQLSEPFDLDRYVWRFDPDVAIAMCASHGLTSVISLIKSDGPSKNVPLTESA